MPAILPGRNAGWPRRETFCALDAGPRRPLVVPFSRRKLAVPFASASFTATGDFTDAATGNAGAYFGQPPPPAHPARHWGDCEGWPPAMKSSLPPGQNEPQIRLTVHAPDRLTSEVMAAALTGRAGIVVVGTAATPEDLRALCAKRRPHIALCHVDTPLAAAAAYRGVRAVSPETDLVAITPAAPGRPPTAIPGLTVLSRSDGLSDLLAVLSRRRPALPAEPRLTSRERTIVYLTGTGLTTREIARRLRLQPLTVENHKRHIYAKLGVNGQSHAVARTMSLGLLQAPEQTRFAGRTGFVLMRGRADACRDAVIRSLVRARLPFLVAHDRDSLRDSRVCHPGSITIVLVDPEPEDWALSISLRAPTLVVRCAGAAAGVPASACAPARTDDESAIADALEHGAHGLIFADDVTAELGNMLAVVSGGHFALSRVYATTIARWRPPVRPELTVRESEILTSIARGDTIRQTARTLGIAAKTVENTQARLFRKLGARNRTETLTIADRWGLLPRNP
jgi:DNA-binding NarL/FixJ family response regulator